MEQSIYKMVQHGVNMGQDGAKVGQHGGKMGQDGAMMGQDGARMAQDGAKMAQVGAQDGSAKTKLECGCGEPSYDSQADSDDDYCSDGCDNDVDHSESSE